MGVVITKRIKILRERANMTQAELAILLGVNENTISNYERGEREPSIDNLKRIAEIFGVSVDELIAD